MNILDPHFVAILAGSGAACQTASLLPSCDIADELKDILLVQNEIIIHMMEGRHFGSDRLDKYLKICHDTTLSMINLRENRGER